MRICLVFRALYLVATPRLVIPYSLPLMRPCIEEGRGLWRSNVSE